MRRITLYGMLSLLFAKAALAGAPAPSTVTVPIDEYLGLRKNAELERVTSLENVTLRGKFGKALSLTFQGRCSGGYAAKEVLQVDDRFTLGDCKGDAILDVSGGKYRLVPLAKTFKLSCELRAANWSGLEIDVKNALAFTSSVTGAEVLAEKSGDGRHVILTEKSRTARPSGEVTGTAKYRITVKPEETEFRYVLRLTNPSRGRRAFRLPFRNGEIVQKARGIASFEEQEKGITLNLTPGDNELVLQGRFVGAKFVPLLPSEQQMLLVESHPTLLLTAEGKGRRVSPTDAELRPQFTNARAYILGKGSELSWTTRKLDVLEATGFAVSSASYRYYLPENGAPVVEATYTVNNQGTPEVGLDVPGTPTYLEVNGSPQVLYKSPEGKMLVQLPPGQSSFMLQYRPERKNDVAVTSVGEQLVKPEAVLSNVSISLLTPSKWRLVFGAGLAGGGSDFGAEVCLLAIATFGLCFLFASLWKFDRRRRWVFAFAAAGLTFFVPEFSAVFAMGAVVSVLCRYRMPLWKFFRGKPVRAFVAIFLVGLPAAAITLAASVALIGTSRNMVAKNMANSNYRAQNVESAQVAAPSGKLLGSGDVAELDGAGGTGAFGDKATEAPSETVSDAAGYQGLPARIDIPSDVSATFFHQSMVDRHGRVMLRAWLVSQSILGGLALLCFLVAATLFWRRRNNVVAWAWAAK